MNHGIVEDKGKYSVGVSEKITDEAYSTRIVVGENKSFDIIMKSLVEYFEKNPKVKDWLRSTIILSIFEDLNNIDEYGGKLRELAEIKADDVLKIIFGEK